MFGRNKDTSVKPANTTKGRVPSVISADMQVLGNVVCEGMLDLDGKIDGNVRCHTVSVRMNGRVHGDVIGDTVHVYGNVEGTIKARSVMLYNSARVQGTIMYESLTIEDGAFVDGKFKRTDKVFIDETMPALGYTPSLDSHFVNDNDEQVSDDELKVLENLRLIS